MPVKEHKTFVRVIEGVGMGAFRAKDLDSAIRQTEERYGGGDILSVDEAEDDQLYSIHLMGGYVPSRDRERLGLKW